MPELLPKIAELSAKLQKDPGSRLFVPLAEEYIKAEMLDEAVQVLTDGLKKHPEFHVARVTLGRIYFQQGKFAEARREFEEVVKVNPDNLIALRKLAVLYRQSKLLDLAKRCCDALLAANPKDAEMLQLLQEIKAAQGKDEQSEISIAPPRSHTTSSSGPGAEHLLENSSGMPMAARTDLATGYVPPQPPSPSQTQTVTPPAPSSPPMDSMGSPAVGDDAQEELVSPTLAQLYLRQGQYAQAVSVYDELLRREPQNESYRQAHNIALTLLQGQQATPGTAQAPPSGSAAPTASRLPEKPPHHPHDRVIDRLQSWLLRIQQQRRRGAS
ncbi:MAG TPA: tetratricopeptide repeat protein [Nitrospiria bacterium]|nr:tetratricopeptide repeat protein [Nitrospiria bacterium]